MEMYGFSDLIETAEAIHFQQLSQFSRRIHSVIKDSAVSRRSHKRLPRSHIDRRILYDTAEAFAKTNIGSQFL
jgi:hypothetical protein